MRDVRKVDGHQTTSNVRIDLVVEGVTTDRRWTCGLEFDYANEESFYCRPLRLAEGKAPDRMPVPAEAADTRIAFLPPMSGLAAAETRLDQGAVNVRIGEGRTAEVLRNLCFRIHEQEPGRWQALVDQVRSLFGSEIKPPRYVAERGEIAMTYQERRATLDLSSSGRGLQQTLLLLAYMYANPGAILLLDEPDAHLEILRQRQIYRLLTEVAAASGSQVIAEGERGVKPVPPELPTGVRGGRELDTDLVQHYFCVVKNVTITLPEDVARWLRVKAAENDRSVSRWIAELLAGMQRQEDEYEVAMKRYLAMKPRRLEWPDGRRPTRADLYDRPGLR